MDPKNHSYVIIPEQSPNARVGEINKQHTTRGAHAGAVCEGDQIPSSPSASVR